MVVLKTFREIEAIRESCKIVSSVLKLLYSCIQVGVSTKELNYLAEDLCKYMGGTPAFRGYKGFPHSICSSINEEIVHGFPSIRKLEEGDIISIDFGAVLNDWHGDAAFTKAVGKVPASIKKLINITKLCLEDGIKVAVSGNRLGDIGYAIESKAKENGFNVITNFVGHGIGKELHEEPSVLNYGAKGEGLILRHGMVIAIEPMLISGSEKDKIMPNMWTVVSKDGSLSAHWEHTIAILDSGTEILTNWE